MEMYAMYLLEIYGEEAPSLAGAGGKLTYQGKNLVGLLRLSRQINVKAPMWFGNANVIVETYAMLQQTILSSEKLNPAVA